MSLHLMECAAEGDQTKNLPPAWKLALMAFADSADKHTHIALPGLQMVMTWSGLSRSRTFEVVNELEELGLLKKHRAGRAGRRAEYIVFPFGCCSLHPKVVDVDDEHDAPAGSDGSDPLGSGGPDSPDGAGSGGSDPEQPDSAAGSDGSDPHSGAGSDQGPTHRTPTPASAGVQVVTRVADPDAGEADPTPIDQPAQPTPSAGQADRDEHGPLSPHCRNHPGGTTAPCGACASRREAFERAERARADVRRRAEQDAAIQTARRERGQAAPPSVRATRAAQARELLAKARETTGAGAR